MPARSWPNWNKNLMKSNLGRRTFIFFVLFYLLLFAIWQVLFSAHLFPDYLLPSPIQVFRRLWELGSDGYLVPSLTATLLRMAVGFLIAALIGLIVGLMMGTSRIINSCLKS